MIKIINTKNNIFDNEIPPIDYSNYYDIYQKNDTQSECKFDSLNQINGLDQMNGLNQMNGLDQMNCLDQMNGLNLENKILCDNYQSNEVEMDGMTGDGLCEGEYSFVDDENIYKKKKSIDMKNEMINIYMSDITIYQTLKVKVDRNIIKYDSIPILFLYKYNIFQFMEMNGLLEGLKGFDIFCILRDLMNSLNDDNDIDIKEEDYEMCDKFLLWIDSNNIDTKTEKQYHVEFNKGNQLFNIFDEN